MSPARVIAAVLRLMIGPEIGVRRQLIVAAMLEAVGLALSVAGPYSLKLLVDRLPSGIVPAMLAVLVAVFVVASTGSTLVASLRMVRVQRIIDALHAFLVRRVVVGRLSSETAAREGSSAETASQLERLPFSLQIVIDGLVWRVAPIAVQVVLCLAVVGASVPGSYVLLLALVLGVYGASTWTGMRRHRVRADAMNKASGRLSATLGDILRNARRVVLNGALGLELGHIATRLGERRAADEAMTWSFVWLAGLQFAAVGGGLMLLLILSGLDVRAGRMTVGDFVLLQAFAFRLILPLSGFGFVMSQAGVALANVSDVLDSARNVPGEALPSPPLPGAAAIHLRGVRFRYGAGMAGVEVEDLAIEPGSFVVIAGPNGSGKSTLAQIMAGVITPDQGEVCIGARDISSVAREWRYQHILYVPQFVGLLDRSLEENVLYPPAKHDIEALVRLLEDWRFNEPGRAIDLSRPAGELGARLSGGQIQKLELARLAGIVTPALILDESTSALDPQAEGLILADLRGRFRGRTTLIAVSHRCGIAALADKVVFLDGGRLRAQGTHRELLESDRHYRLLWEGKAGPASQATK